MFDKGDIVRYLYNPQQTAMVVGYTGNMGDVYSDDNRFAMAVTKDGEMISFLFNSRDWEIVDHVDLSEIIEKIDKAKETKT